MIVTEEQALTDIAEILYVDVAELERDVDLRDQGMDSVRIMALVQQWRQAGLPEVDFIALAEDQRIEHWLTVLKTLQNQ
ncbi:acyl carrier protein [Rhodococcus sp. 06-462-5]|jgi:aryl carrier-like protein|uniref:phosphopantetheine-binding protein n=1 Tax=Nocardiaceae TaxID=85025 RepID=UPI00050C9C74|nr:MULTISPECIES: phosphopantetheine-binding protein [Rhodococcus]MDZ7931368.1 phosphopantetheine-binding protein [Rhodococcus sp. (in: high G+C Gram-positive bacteria)]OZC70792.1 acyl carrier protein [Rhodococcus sp. 06-462-5]OZE68711.1 acyl carrier protein [Rhodococcus sp. 02-925g]